MKRKIMHALASPVVDTVQTSPIAVMVSEQRSAPAQQPVTLLLHWEQNPKHLDPETVATLRGCAEQIARATLTARQRLEPMLSIVR